jgi:hypothetical protein
MAENVPDVVKLMDYEPSLLKNRRGNYAPLRPQFRLKIYNKFSINTIAYVLAALFKGLEAVGR